ncbi:MAG: TrkH family potassium uptake protein [Alphaproteobacteria bacterium]
MTRGLSLLYTLGWFIGGLALAALAAALVATGYAEKPAFTAFLNTAGLCFFVAIALIFAFRGDTNHTYRRRHGLLMVVLAWVVLPALAAVPFVSLMGISGLAGYFEAVSMFTTTGATTAPSIDALPRSLVFWRAALQWFGGALTIVFAAAALDRSRIDATSGQGRGVRLLSGSLANRERLKTVAREVLPIYFLATLACFVALWVDGVAEFDAGALAMSLLSTGGAAVRDAPFAEFGGISTSLIVIVFMALGAANLAGLAGWIKRSRLPARGVAFNPTIVALASIVAIIVAGVALIGAGQGVGVGQALVGGLFAVVSLISTTGYVWDPTVAALLPLALIITLVLIGGSYGSTAGGMKIGRIVHMVGDANQELEHLIHPNAVVVSEERSDGLEPNRVIWSYFAVYLMGMVLVSGLLAAGGMGFEAALAGAAAMLANVGPVFDHLPQISGQGAPTLAELPEGILAGLSGAMILGRIEILAILSILMPVFWRR